MKPSFQQKLGGALAVWVGWVVAARYPVAVAFLGLSAVGFQYTANNLGINTDTADMISPELPWRQDFIDFRESFPGRYRVMLALVEAPNAGQAERAAVALAQRLAARPDSFATVFLPGAEPFLRRNGLLYLNTADLEGLGDRLAQVQPLLGRLGERFSAEQLVLVIDEALDRMDRVQRDELTPLLAELDRTLASQPGYEFDWRTLMSVPGMPNPPQVIVLEPVLDFDRLRPARAAMDALWQEADALTADNPAVRVRITGTVAMEDEELVSVTAGATLAGVLALLMVAVVLYTALRSVVLLVVTVVTLLVGLMGTACFAAATIGHLNLISVAFAVLYIGLGVDFAIHWTLRFLELRRQGMTVERALPATAQGVGTSLIICAVTTAIGFYSFIPTPFSGVSELGFISGTGMFISLFVTVTLLPALLAILPGRVRQDGHGRGVAMIEPLVRRPRRVVLVAMCLGVVAVLLLPGVRFDNNPLNLRDPESESVLAFKAMLAGAAPPLSLFILAEPDAAEVQAQAAAALAAVKSVGTIADLVPVQQADKVFILEDLDLLLGPDFDSLAADPAASPEGLGRAFARLGATLAQLEHPASLEQQLAARLAGLADANRAELISWQRRLTVGLPDELTRLADGLGAAPFDVEQLPEALTTRWRAPDGRQLIEIVPATDISASHAAEAFVDTVRSVLPNATGLPVVHREAGRTVVTAFKLAFTYALVMIGALLWLLLQSARDALLVLAPIVLGAVLTGACSVVFGIPFNFANIIALPLLLGVGVDNGIHMVHRARTEPAAGGDALNTSTSAAVLFSGLTTLASFGNLGFSPHLGMASMGQLLAIGMALTLAATLILLPALLALRR